MKPILFNTDMVKAILKGRKTVTRRVAKPMRKNSGTSEFYTPIMVGDILYVRETWRELIRPIGEPKEYEYKADKDKRVACLFRWKPSIHMPKEAARLFLRVTDVRLKKLHDMELEDFIKEGIILSMEDMTNHDMALWKARELFKDLWNSTAGQRSVSERYSNNYYRNPYVWVIEFEVITAEQAQGK